ncbi:hypothetical protein [Pseudonocardia dioxanivorans]|uniref:hypothetical protein n=1 Tax=Pseudonocardia dioxanivorans TaxID=240495 RepID=UPI001046F35B|nr:hypothetical protein [Pseudonocardia dioxanivorans]
MGRRRTVGATGEVFAQRPESGEHPFTLGAHFVVAGAGGVVTEAGGTVPIPGPCVAPVGAVVTGSRGVVAIVGSRTGIATSGGIGHRLLQLP